GRPLLDDFKCGILERVVGKLNAILLSIHLAKEADVNAWRDSFHKQLKFGFAHQEVVTQLGQHIFIKDRIHFIGIVLDETIEELLASVAAGRASGDCPDDTANYSSRCRPSSRYGGAYRRPERRPAGPTSHAGSYTSAVDDKILTDLGPGCIL